MERRGETATDPMDFLLTKSQLIFQPVVYFFTKMQKFSFCLIDKKTVFLEA
jgi:hypothetical protein